MDLASGLAGIPIVRSTTERATLYPAPVTNQRVQNLATGAFERWDGTQWVTDTVGGRFSVKDFGAVGDGVTNDAAAFQAAVTAAQLAARALYIPNGTYKLLTSIACSANSLYLEGESMTGSVIVAGAVMNAVFAFPNASQVTYGGARNLTIGGGTVANYAWRADMADHWTFERVHFKEAVLANVRIGHGWDNDFIACEITRSLKHGIHYVGNNNNAANLIGTKVFLNAGFGVFGETGGFNLNLIGCTIETNGYGGVYGIDFAGVHIAGTYFEANAQTGWTFANTSETIHADVIFNGAADSTQLGRTYPIRGFGLTENTHNNVYCDYAYYIPAATSGTIAGNVKDSISVKALALVGYHGDITYSLPTKITIGDNDGFDTQIGTVTYSNGSAHQLSTWGAAGIPQVNYFTEDFFRWAVQNAGPGTLTKGVEKYQGFETAAILCDATSATWGITIDVANYPELASQHVYCGAWVKSNTVNAGANVGTSVGFNASFIDATTSWRWIEMQVKMPSVGTSAFGFRCFTVTAGSILWIAKPTLALVGARRDTVYGRPAKPLWKNTAVPSTGTWEVGDRVEQYTPVVGNPKGWRCTVAGTPGTWISEGNL